MMERVVDVKVGRLIGYESVRFNVSGMSHVAELKELIIQKIDIDMDDFFLTYNTKALNDFDLMPISFAGSVPTLFLHLRMKGGTSKKVIKHHLKEDEAVKSLVKKTVASAKQKLPEFEANGAMPSELQALIDPVIQKMNENKSRSINGHNIFLDALENLSDDKIRDLYKVFESTSGVQPDERLVRASYIFVDDLKKLDESVEHIRKTQFAIISSFIESFGDHYTFWRSNDLQFGNAKFKQEIIDMISYRRGLRRASQSEAPEPSQDEGRCLIM